MMREWAASAPPAPSQARLLQAAIVEVLAVEPAEENLAILF